MVRLIILVLIIIGGIWMFRACENDGEKVEFTAKEQNKERAEDKSPREAKEAREEKTSKTESKKEDGEKTTLVGKDGDKKDKEDGKDGDTSGKNSDNKGDTKSDDKDTDKDTTKKSWSQKLADKIKGTDKADSTDTTKAATGDKTSTTGKADSTKSVTGSTNPGSESSYGTIYTGNPSVPQAERKPVVPNRDSYLKVYVYENSIDTFGKPPSTGRIHFSVTNSGEWSQNLHIPGLGDLGRVPGGETENFVLSASKSGDYYIQSYSAVGNAERHMPVVE